MNVSLLSTIPGERLVNPICTCGSPSALKISWTDLNPGRRFFKCNRCNFFLWLDPKVNWYNYLVKYLVRRNFALEADVEDLKNHIEVLEKNNAKLQDGLDEELWKIQEQGNAVVTLQAEVETLKRGQKLYKRVIGALVVSVVVLMMK